MSPWTVYSSKTSISQTGIFSCIVLFIFGLLWSHYTEHLKLKMIELFLANTPTDPNSQSNSTDLPKGVLRPENHQDVRELDLDGIERIELSFPKFVDGRAYSQAFVLRCRLGFKGDIRAVGDVLVDQIVQMQRCGFSSAVLRADQSIATAQRQLQHYRDFYQADASERQPHFVQG